MPILWLLVTSFSTDRGINMRRFFPASYTVSNYVNILFHPDSVAQSPRWFTNTLVVACFNCVISTCFVLMMAYALSCCRFKGRKLLQNLSVIVNLFPGVLAMIAVYFVLKYLNLTNSYAGLIMVYAGSSGLGYLICKGFFDTIPSPSCSSSCRSSMSRASPPAQTRAKLLSSFSFIIKSRTPQADPTAAGCGFYTLRCRARPGAHKTKKFLKKG